MRYCELVTHGGCSPNLLGGWCRGDLFMDDCSEAWGFPFFGFCEVFVELTISIVEEKLVI
jgi:hypothetical protein